LHFLPKWIWTCFYLCLPHSWDDSCAPPCPGIGWVGVLLTFCPGWPQTDPPDLCFPSSWVTDVSQAPGSVFPPRNIQPQFNNEKNIKQIPIEEYSTKHLTSTHQNYVIKTKGKPEKLSRGDMTNKCSTVQWKGSMNKDIR
jgi:hypothetical protein